ncbi:hypothetical protein [Bradyrhizobium sp. SZCCHNS2096]|uniref:hypothetical protein n=1 Tax=Bradyrhizobium sp. SZCCHNS2096 TaxID=3057309 RepID=UPI002916BDD9|nr:hypothetical protein [Bradyrhizobium sp. SZCCHNS2096]
MNGIKEHRLLSAISVSLFLLFSQHAMAQQVACSQSEIATVNLENQRFAQCLQQYGIDNILACSQVMVARLNEAVSPTCQMAVEAFYKRRPNGSGSDAAMRECLKRCTALPSNMRCQC